MANRCLLMDINNTMMWNTHCVKTQEVRVLSEDDADFLYGKRQMFLVLSRMQPRLLRGDHIYATAPQACRHRSRDMLIHVELDTISHRSFLSVSRACGCAAR